jgi:hypothetical protein
MGCLQDHPPDVCWAIIERLARGRKSDSIPDASKRKIVKINHPPKSSRENPIPTKQTRMRKMAGIVDHP